MFDTVVRQLVWNSAFAELDGVIPEAHELATRIANRFAEENRARRSSRNVSEATRTAIKHDLTVGYRSYDEIRKQHGVGTSTVQRLAHELRAQGVTVHTIGSRNAGRAFPRTTALGRVGAAQNL